MSGVAFEIEETGLVEALHKIDGIATVSLDKLAEGIGRQVQSQTRRRIEVEKTSPGGEPWRANRAGTSILYQTGKLAESIDYVASPDSVIVGSGLVYARIHQLGGKIVPKSARALAFKIGDQFRLVQSITMPARPYLGMSADNRREIVQGVEDELERLIE